MEAIGHAGSCLGIVANNGIVVAAEKRTVHKLLDETVAAEKIYRLSRLVHFLLNSECLAYHLCL